VQGSDDEDSWVLAMTDRGQLIISGLNILSIALSLVAILISTRSLRRSGRVLREIDERKHTVLEKDV